MTTGQGPRVLVVAGSDSSGGAGLARDLETIGELGARGAVAVTAITVQTDAAVEQISPLAPDLIAAQMRAAFSSGAVGAVKIGLLPATETIRALAGVLAGHEAIPVVLDPVIASSSGTRFLDDATIASLKGNLMPLCSLITPNLAELALLAGVDTADSDAAALAQARALVALGARAVLIKGGHASGSDAEDILLDDTGNTERFSVPRLAGTMRGTGCMLSTAIACHLAQGAPLGEACQRAKSFVFGKFAAAMSARPL